MRRWFEKVRGVWYSEVRSSVGCGGVGVVTTPRPLGVESGRIVGLSSSEDPGLPETYFAVLK